MYHEHTKEIHKVVICLIVLGPLIYAAIGGMLLVGGVIRMNNASNEQIQIEQRLTEVENRLSQLENHDKARIDAAHP